MSKGVLKGVALGLELCSKRFQSVDLDHLSLLCTLHHSKHYFRDLQLFADAITETNDALKSENIRGEEAKTLQEGYELGFSDAVCCWITSFTEPLLKARITDLFQSKH
jgi:hypothetical protein